MAEKVTFTVAKTDDGGVQITFTIPFTLIKAAREKALTELAKEVEIPGFRKGNAPLPKVEEKLDPQILIEKTLASVLPEALGQAINENKLRLAIYPKFEAIKIGDGEDWQIKAVSCELPEVNLGNYKDILKLKAASSLGGKIWTPDKGNPKDIKAPSREEKEQAIIKTLIEEIKINVPKMLIEEEANMRLSDLLARLEKLGLTLESYLNSIGKTPQSLREEYETQAKQTLALELILEKVAKEENIKVEEAQITEAIKASASADPKLAEKLDTPERRRLVSSVLRRRASLDSLVNLI